LMDGTIWVESDAEAGSTFHFTVRTGTLGANGEPNRATDPEFQGVPILIVDDSELNRRVLSELAKDCGMLVLTAANSREGIEEIERTKKMGGSAGVILVDAQMGGTSGLAVASRFRNEPAILESTIMMLNSVNQVSDAVMCRELGIPVCLVKPVCEREFRQAVSRTLRRNPQGEAGRSALPVAERKVRSVQTRVLLVEDNAVNQMLAVRMLEKRGYHVTRAENGREALEALKKDSFELVLMDLQMPGMDGLEATAAIRNGERGSGRHLPIIAMTAHAMKGDEERCLAAGMDGYVSKPIAAKELVEAIERVLEKGLPVAKN